MAQSLHLGRENVIESIAGLPKTKHDISGAPSAFCLDGWLAGSTLFVTVHGQFTEGMSFFFPFAAAKVLEHTERLTIGFSNRTGQRVAFI